MHHNLFHFYFSDVRDFCYCAAIGFKIVPTVRVQCQDTAGKKKNHKAKHSRSYEQFHSSCKGRFNKYLLINQ